MYNTAQLWHTCNNVGKQPGKYTAILPFSSKSTRALPTVNYSTIYYSTVW